MTKTRTLIRQAFDPDALTRVCTAEESEFSAYGKRTDLKPARDGRERFYFHRDNGSRILGVAHLDSVCETRRCDIMDTASGPLVCSPALDDRLGAYVILELLPKLGITVDWLLTTGEEMGDSTAAEFEPQHEYDWMFGFDRGGTDVVMYQYETPRLVDLVETSGAQVGTGSFSDISVLDHLGCAGFNWGVGYRNYHGPRAHAWLRDTFRQVGQFGRFYAANVGTKLPYSDGWGDNLECLCGLPLDDDDFCVECDADKVARREWWRQQDAS